MYEKSSGIIPTYFVRSAVCVDIDRTQLEKTPPIPADNNHYLRTQLRDHHVFAKVHDSRQRHRSV